VAWTPWLIHGMLVIPFKDTGGFFSSQSTWFLPLPKESRLVRTHETMQTISRTLMAPSRFANDQSHFGAPRKLAARRHPD
jgi:hypothetical protein